LHSLIFINPKTLAKYQIYESGASEIIHIYDNFSLLLTTMIKVYWLDLQLKGAIFNLNSTKTHQNMLIIVFRLTAIFIFLLSFSGSVLGDSGRRYSLNPVDDPLILEYRFVQMKTSKMNDRDYWLPIDSRGTGQMGLCLIGNNWLPSDSLTSVIFYEDLFISQAIRHYNFKTLEVDGFMPFNFNNSGAEEITVSYHWDDSVWLEMLSIDENMHYKKMLGTGIDLNGNGYWDGHAFFVMSMISMMTDM